MFKKGFTLIEMLAVVVILVLLFLVVTPKLTAFIKNSENTNKELIEEKIINASKEYVTNYNTKFLINIYNVGDYINLNVEELLNTSLIEESDITESGVSKIKIELVAGNKFKYTLIYE